MRILLALAAVLLPAAASAQGPTAGPCPPGTNGPRWAVECLLDASGSLRAALYESTNGTTQEIVVHDPGAPPGAAGRTLTTARAASFRDVSPALLSQIGGPAPIAAPGAYPHEPAALPMNPARPGPLGLPPGTRVIERTYDQLDRIESETVPLENGGTATVRYSYYPDGRRRTTTDAFGRVAFYEYDGRGSLARVTTDQGLPDEHVTTYAYWPDNLLRSITRPNGTVTAYEYDRADRLRSVVVRRDAALLLSHEYTYDANGNRLTQVETNGGPPETTSYTYDALNRLESVAYPGGASATYEYDAVGNRTREVERNASGVVVSDKTAVFDPINRMSSITDAVEPSNNATLAYDRNGNLLSKTTAAGTEEYDYDARDLLVETRSGMTITGRFAYDAFGRRYLKYGLEGARQYLYDETSTLHELSETGLEVAKYEYGGDRMLSFVRSNEPRRFHHQDALGSVVALTDSDGTVVARYHLDAWGRYRFPSELDASANRFGFTGYLFDQETDLYYAKARFYDPELGRFITQDAVLGQVDEPPSLHRYAYGFANPLRYVDPTGHAAVDMQALADEEAARVAAIRAQRGRGVFASNQGQGAGRRQRLAGNDTDLDEVPLGPDERRRFAEAQRKAGLSAATSASVDEEGRLGSGDAVVDAALDRRRTLDSLEKIGKVGGEGGRLALELMWGPVEDATILSTGSNFREEPASRGWAGVSLGGSYLVRIGGRVVTVTKHTDSFADDAVRALREENDLTRAERRVDFGSHGGEFADDSIRMVEQPAASRRLAEQPRDTLGHFASKTHPGQRMPGVSAVDDFASKATANGFDVVGREVAVNTPFGQRRYDVVLRDRTTGAIHGVEVKSSQNAFEKFDEAARQQFAADRWVNRWGADAVGQYKGVRIEGSSKILWDMR
jgi:RHS repeat-associated protein